MVTAHQGFTKVGDLLPDLLVPHVLYADAQTNSSTAV